MDEDDHALEHVAGFGEIWRVPCVSLGVDIFQGDFAAGLPVIRDEALGLVPREAGIRVLAVAYQIPPEKWEEIVAGAFKKAQYDEVTLTPRSGDRGRDINVAAR